MMQPATAQLGRSKTGLTIGYRLLDPQRNQLQAWTRQGVTETAIPGTYAATVNEPDMGGFIVWGLVNQDLAEAPICCDMPTPDPMPAMREALDMLHRAIVAAMPGTPVVQMDTQPFEQGVSELRRTVGDQVTEINATLATVREQIDHLSLLNDAATSAEIVRSMRDKMTEVLGDQAPIVRMMTDNSPSELTAILEMMRRDVDRLATTADGMTAEKAARERIRKAAEALNRFEAQLPGKQ